MLRGFLLSVLAGTIVGGTLPGALFALLTVGGGAADWAMTGRGILLAFEFALVLVVGGALVFGLPLTFLLSRTTWENSGAYGLTGGLLGFAEVELVLAIFGRDASGMLMAIPLAVVGGCSGCAAGITWWTVYRRLRPVKQTGKAAAA